MRNIAKLVMVAAIAYEYGKNGDNSLFGSMKKDAKHVARKIKRAIER